MVHFLSIKKKSKYKKIKSINILTKYSMSDIISYKLNK